MNYVNYIYSEQYQDQADKFDLEFIKALNKRVKRSKFKRKYKEVN